MGVFEQYLNDILDQTKQQKLRKLLQWISFNFPKLEAVIKWNQPMFLTHQTFIIGFSISNNHFSVSLERAGMIQFRDLINDAGYSQTDNLFRILWNQDINYELIRKMIEYNINDKISVTTFWR